MTLTQFLTLMYYTIAKVGCGWIGYDLEIDYGRITESR